MVFNITKHLACIGPFIILCFLDAKTVKDVDVGCIVDHIEINVNHFCACHTMCLQNSVCRYNVKGAALRTRYILFGLPRTHNDPVVDIADIAEQSQQVVAVCAALTLAAILAKICVSRCCEIIDSLKWLA